MTRSEYNHYKKAWRKRHPHYERNLMRLKRGNMDPWEPNSRGCRPLGCRIILGVPVRLDVWRVPR